MSRYQPRYLSLVSLRGDDTTASSINASDRDSPSDSRYACVGNVKSRGSRSRRLGALNRHRVRVYDHVHRSSIGALLIGRLAVSSRRTLAEARLERRS